jgi:hypothetical protein
MGKQKSLVDKIIQILTHTVDKSPANLSHYDVVLTGDNLSWMMTRNLTKITHGHKMIYFDPPQGLIQALPLRIPFESKAVKDSKYSMLYSELLDVSMGMNNTARIQTILPNENAVVFNNGRKVTYSALLIASGYQAVPEAIPGLIEGVNIQGGRVYSTLPKITNPLFYSFISLFEHGDAFIYIPEFPFQNEVEHLNFLYALSTWELNEELGVGSPLRKLTIVNANDRFASKCDVLDQYIRKRLEGHSKVDVLFNTKLKNINNKDSTITIEDQNGQTKNLEFRRLYCHVPVKPDPLLVNSGFIGANEKKIKVDPKTLAAEGHENIFVFGENLDLPIQPSFEAAMVQAHVARHNALEYIEGRRPNAEYKGQTRIPLFVGFENVAMYTSDWEKGPQIKDGWINEWWNYRQMSGGFAKKVRETFLSKRGSPSTKKFLKWGKGEQVRQVTPSEHHH